MNHSLCWTSLISKLTHAISILNLWSKSQTISLGNCLISFNSVMYYASDFGFLNSSSSPFWISSKVFAMVPCRTCINLIYQSSTQPQRVVANFPFFTSSSVFYLAIKTSSHKNQYYSRSSVPFPWNIGSFISSPAILDLLPANDALLLDVAWHVENVEVDCIYFPDGGVVRGGVDMLLPGFDLTYTLGVAWVCSSSSSL